MGVGNTNRLSATTLNKYLKKPVRPLTRKSVIFGMMVTKGKVKWKDGALALKWNVETNRRTLNPITGAEHRTSFQQDYPVIALEMDWAMWEMGLSINIVEKLKNQNAGDAQWLDLVQRVVEKGSEDATTDLQTKFWQDGNATGCGGFMGMESFLGHSGLVSSSFLCAPHDEYCGKDTDLGTFGGSWTGTYPDGSGPYSYNVLSPTIVDYCDTNQLAHGTVAANYNTWENSWQYAVNALVTTLGTLQDAEPDVIVMNRQMYAQACDSLVGKQQLTIGDPNSDLVKLGHKVRNYNGVDLVYEYGVRDETNDKDAVGYAINFDHVYLTSLLPQLIATEEDHDIVTSDDLKKIMVSLQAVWESPAYFGKLYPQTELYGS